MLFQSFRDHLSNFNPTDFELSPRGLAVSELKRLLNHPGESATLAAKGRGLVVRRRNWRRS